MLGVLVALGPAGPAGSGVLAPGGRDGARMGVPSLHAAKMAPGWEYYRGTSPAENFTRKLFKIVDNLIEKILILF